MRLPRLPASLGGVALLYACLSPTQITARISTDVDCSTVDQNGVSLYDADPKSAPITSTRACTGSGALHDIGTLVVTPSGDNDQGLSVVVVAGVKRPSEECAANDYKGCIVARRRMHFFPHEPLDLPIELFSSCLNVPCNDEQTCFRGACISAEVQQPINGCLGPDCQPYTDGGGNDAATVTDAAPGGWQLAQDTNGLKVRGLTADDTNLWWTQESGNPALPSQIYKAPLGSLTPRSLVKDSTDNAYGIAVNPAGDYYLVALQNGGACVRLNDTAATFDCFEPAIGVAAKWGPNNAPFWVTTASNAYLSSDSRPVGIPGGYIEGNDTGAWFVSGNAVYAVDWVTQPPKATPITTVDVLPQPGRGFAMSSTHWFVSTTDGALYAVSHAPNPVPQTLVPPGSLTNVEDILYDERSSTLYAAGVRGTTAGIFSRTIAQGDLK